MYFILGLFLFIDPNKLAFVTLIDAITCLFLINLTLKDFQIAPRFLK
jgi:hypothetical protein